MGALPALGGLLRSLAIYYGMPILRRGRMRRLYAEFIQPGDLCFDIGAHVGNRLRTFLALGARVVAVEPHPGLMRLLRRWYGDHPRVTLIEAAISDRPGSADLHISRKHPTLTTLSAEWIAEVRQTDAFANVHWDETTTVPITTLDELIAAHGAPSFCKLDIEGSEDAALRGLSQPLPAISFEYLPASIDGAIHCLDRLESLGAYRYNWSVGEEMRFASPAWIDAPSMRQQINSLNADAPSGDVYAQLAS